MESSRSAGANVSADPFSPPAGPNADTAKPPDFVREHALRIIVISALFLLPCFWHRRLEAGDLSSHIYNAWLAQLIDHNQAPGLWLAKQSTNVLFDWFVGGLGRVFSLEVSGNIAGAFAALVFFWGVFTFICVATRQRPWFLVPIIAVVTYGWTFNSGVFNYFLSVGLSFFGLAIFWAGKEWARLAAFALAPLIWLAHPLGVAWMLAAALYIAIAEHSSRLGQLFLVLASVGMLEIAHVYLPRHYELVGPAHSVLFYNGLDQMLFTSRYEVPVLMFCAVFGLALAIEGLREGIRHLFNACSIPLQLYVIVEAGVQLLPDAIRLPQYAAPLSDLSERLTLISAVLLCTVLGTVQPRKWHLFAFAGVAALFFISLYRDTSTLNQMQRETDLLVHTLPPGQRILLTIHQPLKYRFSPKHLLDLSCVGYCVSYGNYEPATGQFRVRARPGNAFVLSDIRDVSGVEAGSYVVKSSDSPLYQIYQCRPDWTDLCMRQLRAGETTGHLEDYASTR